MDRAQQASDSASSQIATERGRLELIEAVERRASTRKTSRLRSHEVTGEGGSSAAQLEHAGSRKRASKGTCRVEGPKSGSSAAGAKPTDL